MIDIATIAFRDLEKQSAAVAVLRVNGESVHLCFSVASNGDVEFAMDKVAAKELLHALSKAVSDPTFVAKGQA
jgi:hypothetical protein